MIAWTIYDHPSDHPEGFVARAFRLDQGPDPVPTAEVMTSPDINAIRRELAGRGLACFARTPIDDPVIVETWL